MKSYFGIPGPPVAVVVSDEHGAKPLEGGPFGWGKLSLIPGGPSVPDQGGATLARAILADYLGAEKAERIYRRYFYRVFPDIAAEASWRLEEYQIDAVIDEIESIDPMRARVAATVNRAPAPIASEGGIGAGSGEALPPIERKM